MSYYIRKLTKDGRIIVVALKESANDKSFNLAVCDSFEEAYALVVFMGHTPRRNLEGVKRVVDISGVVLFTTD